MFHLKSWVKKTESLVVIKKQIRDKDYAHTTDVVVSQDPLTVRDKIQHGCLIFGQ